MEYLYYIVGIIVSIVLFFIDYSYAFGVLIALVALFVLSFIRKAFYKRIMGMDKFNSKLFLSHSLVVVGLTLVPLVISYFFPEMINPYFVVVTIFFERIYDYFKRTFFPDKEGLNV